MVVSVTPKVMAQDPEVWLNVISTTATAVGVALTAVAVYSVARRGSRWGVTSSTFDAEIEAARSKPQTTDTDLIERQYALLREYHAEGLAQSKISFWFSLVFAALGFLVIVSGLFTFETTLPLLKQGRSATALIAGTIIDAVSALFFVQSNKARELMVQFFDRFRSDRKLDEALRLAKDVPDAAMRSRLYVVLALHFADLRPTDAFVPQLLGSSEQPDPPVPNR